MSADIHIRPAQIEGLADLTEAIAAALELDLPQGVLERLNLLCEGIGNRIVSGDLSATTEAGVYDLPLRLELDSSDVVFLAALRARDIGAIIRHSEGPSVSGVAECAP